MMRKNDAGLILAGLVGTLVLSGCGGNSQPANTLPDGDYTGQSSIESDGTYGIVNFVVSDGDIVDASFVMYDPDGTPHDESYGLGSQPTRSSISEPRMRSQPKSNTSRSSSRSATKLRSKRLPAARCRTVCSDPPSTTR